MDALKRRGMHAHTTWVALLAVALAPQALSAEPFENEQATSIEEAFAARFPETIADTITCDGFGPLCQVVAGSTVFYVDPEARHAFIGRLYDLDQKRDLTEETLKALAPKRASEAPLPPSASWASLPLESAIVRNKGGSLKVAVFSDLHCGYCRNLSVALAEAPDIEVHEFLVGMAGSEAASRAIGCADDPESAVHTYYSTQMLPAGACDRDIVGPARAAAEALGPAMQGTPTFVRPDGAVTSGFRHIDDLRAWLQEGETGQ